MSSMTDEERIQTLEVQLRLAQSELSAKERTEQYAADLTSQCTAWEREVLDGLAACDYGWDAVRLIRLARRRANVKRALEQPTKLEKLRALTVEREHLMVLWQLEFDSLALPFPRHEVDDVFKYCSREADALSVPVADPENTLARTSINRPS